MMANRNLIPTCSLCTHFDAIHGKCTVTNQSKVAYDIDSPKACIEASQFVRYIYVIPGIFNYYYPDEQLPPLFSPDFSKVPKDTNGRALVIQTRRGLERAIPISYEIKLSVNPLYSTVDHIYVRQGQQELIQLLGYEYTKKLADKYDVPFIGQPKDMIYEGSEKERLKFEKNEQLNKILNNRGR